MLKLIIELNDVQWSIGVIQRDIIAKYNDTDLNAVDKDYSQAISDLSCALERIENAKKLLKKIRETEVG